MASHFVFWLRAATNSDMTLGALKKNVDESIMKKQMKGVFGDVDQRK